MDDPYEQLLKTLSLKGYKENQIGDLVSKLMMTATSQLFTEIIMDLSDQEKQQVENEPDDDKAKALMLTFYKQHNQGVDLEEKVRQFRNQFAKDYLKKLENF